MGGKRGAQGFPHLSPFRLDIVEEHQAQPRREGAFPWQARRTPLRIPTKDASLGTVLRMKGPSSESVLNGPAGMARLAEVSEW